MSAPDPIEEAEAIADWKAGDILAGGRLLKMHAGLIHFAVRRYVTDRCELDDLLQVGRMALLAAATDHDAARGTLATYAMRRMRGHAWQCMRRCRYVVQVSAKAEALASARTVWLDAPIGEGDRTLLDVIAAPMPGDDAPALDLVAMIANLPDRERHVMQRLCETPAPTLTALGQELGVTVSAVYKTREKAIGRIRTAIQKARAERAGGLAAVDADDVPRTKCVDCPALRATDRIRCTACLIKHARKARDASAVRRQAA